LTCSFPVFSYQLAGGLSDDCPDMGQRLSESGLARSGGSRNDIAPHRWERTSASLGPRGLVAVKEAMEPTRSISTVHQRSPTRAVSGNDLRSTEILGGERPAH
jgi:hypothetical protein